MNEFFILYGAKIMKMLTHAPFTFMLLTTTKVKLIFYFSFFKR